MDSRCYVVTLAWLCRLYTFVNDLVILTERHSLMSKLLYSLCSSLFLSLFLARPRFSLLVRASPDHINTQTHTQAHINKPFPFLAAIRSAPPPRPRRLSDACRPVSLACHRSLYHGAGRWRRLGTMANADHWICLKGIFLFASRTMRSQAHVT